MRARGRVAAEALPIAGRTLADRPAELQDALNRHLYHPLARQLALRLAATRVTPNVVSLAGGSCVVAAGCLYAQSSWPVAALSGMLIHMFWHVLDGADGDLARLTGTAGPMGEIIDGISDYLSHTILYLIIAATLVPHLGATAWVLAVLSGASRIVQSNFHETCKRQYMWWMYDRPWLRKTRSEAEGQGGPGGPLAGLVKLYLWIGEKMDGRVAELDRDYDRLCAAPGGRDHFRRIISTRLRPGLKQLNLLGANHRTLFLGVTVISASPAFFFLYEIVALNIVLVWLAFDHARSVSLAIADLRADQPGG